MESETEVLDVLVASFSLRSDPQRTVLKYASGLHLLRPCRKTRLNIRGNAEAAPQLRSRFSPHFDILRAIRLRFSFTAGLAHLDAPFSVYTYGRSVRLGSVRR